MPRGSERRRAKRFPHDSQIEIEWGSATLVGRVTDISSDGMFVETGEPLWVGAKFGAVWSLANPIRIECAVRRVEPARGMGVSFAAAHPDDQQRVATLVEALERQ